MNHVRPMPIDLPPGFDLLDLQERAPGRYPYLLESVGTGRDARYDILFAEPGESLVLGSAMTLTGASAFHRNGFLASLDAWWERERVPGVDSELPFQGGWFLFLGYELVHEVEPSVAPPTLPGMPVAFATRVPAGIVRDRQTGSAWIVSEPGHDDAVARIGGDIAELRNVQAAHQGPPGSAGMNIREPEPGQFLRGVGRIRDFIAAGDVFQVNLARRWQGLLADGHSPADVYRRLRKSNPAPFAGLAVHDGIAIASSSPERLVRVRNGMIETRPIAGTRPRQARARDEDSRRELLASPKERAEHVMLIDLERNDLGRVCVPGTVEVDEFMSIESYAHVHHIVSNVRGRVGDDATPGKVIRAVFPGGTITGCPKVRCMQIIAGLEEEPRGPYTGAIGYLNRDGSCDLNILIRTIVMKGNELSFSAGSGIVADSDAERELEETRAKAKGMILALEG